MHTGEWVETTVPQNNCYDSAMELSTEEIDMNDEYIKIEVRNPRTHISRDKALYTDYEILVQTSNIAFSSSESCVRRRYSDFQWLRDRLITQFILEGDLPELPPKRLFGRFKRQFLKHRQRGLQRFLENITSKSAYLSDISVHLFLQSALTIKQIEAKINGTDAQSDVEINVRQPTITTSPVQTTTSRSKSKSLSCVLSECEGDSGFSYSTTSSISDLMSPHANHIHHKFNGLLFDCPTDHKTNLRRHLHQESLEKKDDLSTDDSSCSDHSDNEAAVCYDADDEVERFKKLIANVSIEQNNNNNEEEKKVFDDEELFSFRPCKKQCLEQTLELLTQRPKPSERFFNPAEDSDDCFRESEYDVIDLEEEIVEHSPIYRSRSVSSRKSQSKKMIIGKVKSLPNLRFPIKAKSRKPVRRSLTFQENNRRPTLQRVQEEKDVELSLPVQLPRVDELKRSDSDCQQLTSDADYLTTIHTQAPSNDSHLEEDSSSSAVYRLFRKKRKTAASLFADSQQEHRGRFCVSVVDSVVMDRINELNLESRNNSRNSLIIAIKDTTTDSQRACDFTNTNKVEESSSFEYHVDESQCTFPSALSKQNGGLQNGGLPRSHSYTNLLQTYEIL